MSNSFPLSHKYSEDILRQRSRGGNVLYATECLTREMNLQPGMRVLDLGCGKALSSVFLAKEYGVDVVAVDSYFSPDDNYEFISAHGCQDQVMPLKLDVRLLPFPCNYFDAIIAVNSYTYFGTDDKYLPYIARFLKTGGRIGVSDICLTSEIEQMNDVPEYLKANFADRWYYIHSPQWWAAKWEKTDLLQDIRAGLVAEQEEMRQAYMSFYQDTDDAFAAGLRQDDQERIGFFYMTGTRNDKEAFWEDAFG